MSGIHEISNPASTTYAIAFNPLTSNYTTCIEVETTNLLSTGQPMLIQSSTGNGVYDLIYSTYEIINEELSLEEDEGNTTGVKNEVFHGVAWSVGNTTGEADTAIADIEALLPYLKLSSIKHPDREEYAFAYYAHLVSAADAGALKTTVEAKHTADGLAGNVKTTAEMFSDDWV